MSGAGGALWRLAARTGLLAALLAASPARAQEMPLAPRSDFGQIVASERQMNGVVLEQMIGETFDSEPAYTIAERSIYRRLGRAVGRLDVLTDKGTGYCTAWIVSERYLVTNHHCVPGRGDLTVQAVQFVAGYVETGVRDGTAVFNVSTEPVETDAGLDYAVLEVFGNPARDWGTLDISAIEMTSETHGGLPLLIIGHPIRLALHFSRKECRAALRNAVADGKLRHTCDTLQGNSGSPVLSEDTREVIALHHAGSASEGVNFAIPMSAIVAHSEVLRGLVEAAAPAPEPDPEPDPVADPDPVPDPCEGARAHFDLARDIGTVGAYEAHLELFSPCVYAGFARNAVARLRADAEPVDPPPPDPDPVPVVDVEPEPRPDRAPPAPTAEARVRDMIARFHDDMEVSAEAVGRHYYDRMVVNGVLKEKPEIMAGQRASFARSPRREVTLHPETLTARCTEIYCRLSYENTSVTWPGGVRTPERYRVRSSVLLEGERFLFTEVTATRCASLSRC